MEPEIASKSGAKLTLDDEGFLRVIADERSNAVGYDNDDELSRERKRALEYYKGEMSDIPTLENRSSVASLDVFEAVQTALPDILEILTGGDDPLTFKPVGEEDMEAAKQETDFVYDNVFNENDGFMNIFTALQDAMREKVGIWKWFWNDYEYEEDTREGVSGPELEALIEAAEDPRAGFEVASYEPSGEDDIGVLFNVTLRERTGGGTCEFMAVPPEDFIIAKDCTRPADATYCAMRSRPRVQDLVAEGYDKDKLDKLPEYSADHNEEIKRARDTAGESETDDEPNYLRQVEVWEHYLRIDADGDGKPEIYKILTGDDERTLIDKERVDEINFAAITPFPQGHRFFGLSIADIVSEIQGVKTALWRMMLDSGYFAQNQRIEVSERDKSPNTIPDLLDNSPGVPVRSETGNALKPIQAGQLGFDVTGAIELTDVMAERRTSFVRNAQGLNPDTLHDTAAGAAMLMSNAQKRVRMMARIFAETGLKDLFLGIHETLRKHATIPQTVRLRGEWVEIAPTSWQRRKDMTIEVGVGSGGRDQDVIGMRALLDFFEKVITLQSEGANINGPFITEDQIYEFGRRFIDKLGVKGVDSLWANPRRAPPDEGEEIDPETEEMQAKMAIEASKLQMEQAKASAKAQTDMAKIAQDAALKREQLERETALKIREQDMEAALKREAGEAKLEDTRFGGEVG